MTDAQIEDLLDTYVDGNQLGQNNLNRKPMGYWKDIDNVLLESRKVMSQLGVDELPAHDVLIKEGYSALTGAIGRYHSYREIRERLDQPPVKKVDSYWNDPQVIESESRGFMQENGFEFFPSRTKLKKLGRYDLLNAIHKYYPGNHRALREKLGQDPSDRGTGYWNLEENVVRECTEFMQEHGFDLLPSTKVMDELGRGDLSKGIQNHYGMKRVRSLFGEKTRSEKPRGYWKDPDNVLNEAKEFMKKRKLRKFPTLGSLNKMGSSSLRVAIGNYPGGLDKFYEDLGTDAERWTTPGYWKDEENLLSEIDSFLQTNELDNLPPYQVISQMGRQDIVRAIVRHHGGFNSFRPKLNEHLGIESDCDQLELLLDKYIGGSE